MIDKIEDFIIDHTFLAFVMFVGTIIAILLLLTSAYDNAKWNNGYCSCGGKWEYVQPIGHAYTTSHLYKCDTCGKSCEFDKER